MACSLSLLLCTSCSAIYEGLTTCQLKCLDRVLRTTARLVGSFLGLAGSVGIYMGYLSLAPLPTAHCLPHLCIGLASLRGSSTTLSEGTLLFYCSYSTSYLIALLSAGGVTDPPYADCYPKVLRLFGGWSYGLEWSTGCATSDASGPLCSNSLWP